MTPSTITETPIVREYLAGVSTQLAHLPPDEQRNVLDWVLAEIELEGDLQHVDSETQGSVQALLDHLGKPDVVAQRAMIRSASPIGSNAQSAMALCRTCRRQVSADALHCPMCGAPYPARRRGFGPGYEWRSRAAVRGWPLVHVAWGRDANGRCRVARGVIAIGQYGIGVFTIAQFGIAFVFGLGQFMLAPIAVGQFAGGIVAAGQVALGVVAGAGQVATGVFSAGMKAFGVWTRSLL